jgi:arginine:agmatine antiporter
MTNGTTSEHRTLGLFLATMTVAGCMIGSGIYMLPASLGAFGSVSILSWLVATAGACLIGGSLAWLAVLDPESGGMFTYIAKAFGPAAGFVAGVLYWVSALPGAVAVAIGCTGYLGVFVPAVRHGAGATLSVAGFIWLFVGANWIGPRFVARLQGWSLGLGLVPVLLAALGGWFFFHSATFTHSWNPSGASLVNVVPRGAVMAFWAFLGLEGAVILAPRIKNPSRNVPLATLGGLALAAAIYIAACAALMGILPAVALSRSTAPFADAAAVAVGGSLAGLIALCALAKASGALGGNMLLMFESLECESVTAVVSAAPRILPRVSGANLLFTGALATLVVLVSQSPTLVRQFTMVTDVVVVISMLIYAAACLALVRVAQTLSGNRKIAASLVGLGGALFCAFVVAASEPGLLIWSALPVAGALIAYRLAVMRRRRKIAVAAHG